MKILTLILEGYQDIELSGVIGTITMSGELKKITYYHPDAKQNVFGAHKIGSINTTSKYNVEDYDAIFIPGGKMAQELRNNKIALDTIQNFINHDKYIISICDSPNVLCEKKLITNKKYVSYPIIGIENAACSKRILDANVLEDHKYITGRNPFSSIELGLKVIEILVSKEKSIQTKLIMSA